MDTGMMGKVIDWIQDNVGEQSSKQELMSKAQGSDLPQEGKDAIQQLPEGTHSKNEVMDHVKGFLMGKAGKSVAGMVGAGPGRQQGGGGGLGG